MELHLLGLDFSVTHVAFVSAQNDWDAIVEDTNQILVPLVDTVIRGVAGHVEHDDGTLSLDAARNQLGIDTNRVFE